jgi:hypothetical protein
MANIFYKLFGCGALPQPMRPVLEAEGIVLVDEGVSGSVCFKKFRAPGKRYSYRRNGVVASLVITKLRFAVFNFGTSFVNLPLERAQLDKINPAIDGKGRLTVSFDTADFYPNATGNVSGRFATAKAYDFLRWIESVR